ncbi:MAG: hypothetical protein IKG21_00535 [Atopobiaceae bacterium]|nr:hypothetical protein [Atopobiaceae bacterium]
MTRNKTIGSFVAVWLAICLLYLGVRTAVTSLTNSQTITRADAEVASSAAELEELSEQEEPTGLVDPTEQATPDAAAQSEPVAQTVSDGSSAHTGPIARDERPQEEVADEAQATDIPSLDEYLSGFTCGSCRRNCSLDNPRCHNGSRLAQAKAEEYYRMYGER